MRKLFLALVLACSVFAAASTTPSTALAAPVVPADTGFLKIHVTGDTAAKCYVKITSPVTWTRVVKADSSKDTTFIFASNTGADTTKKYSFVWFIASTDSVGRGLKSTGADTLTHQWNTYAAPVEGKGTVTAKSGLVDSVSLNRTAIDTLTCASVSAH